MDRCDRLRQRLYRLDQLDNDYIFLRTIEACIVPGSVVLDLGAGTGFKFRYDLKSKVEPGGEIVGADFDSRVCENPLLHRGVVLDGARLPFDDGIFDVVFSRYVLEHVVNPSEFLSEVHRVLKAGGSFLFLTRISGTTSPSRPDARRIRFMPGTIDCAGARIRILFPRSIGSTVDAPSDVISRIPGISKRNS